MESTLLWQTFLALSPLERKHVAQWLRSPFFCRRAAPLLLWDYLLACQTAGMVPDPAIARVKAGCTDDKGFHLLVSELLGQLEHFLVYRHRFEQDPNFDLDLAAAYRKRGLEKHFRQRLHAARVAWARQAYRHAEYFEAQAAIEYEWYQYLSANRRTETLNLQEISDMTDTAYIARKLRQACFALSHQTVFKADYHFGLLGAVLAHVRTDERLQALPAVALYYYCYLFLAETDGEGYFRHFKRQLLAQLDQLPADEQRNLHLLAINFCIRKINQLQTAYFREALDLYQSALNADLLLENGQLSQFAYNNIVAIALKVGENDWAESFVHTYAPALEKKSRAATFHLNLARVAYSRRQLDAALLHLQQADYKDLINNLIAKTLQVKIYYETGEFDALDAHLQSMQTFIRRQRGIGYHKINYLNIVRYARRLMQHNPHDLKAREALRRQIEAETALTEKEWFLEMLG